jgi:hypothetical protein
MRVFLTIPVVAFVLAGCAGNHHELADSHVCEPSAPASQGVTSQLFPSSRLSVPARSLLGSGKLDNDDTMTWACADPASNTGTAPEVPNPHKITVPRLPGI